MAGARFKLFSDVPRYSMQVEIEARVYSLRLAWNHRDGFWYLALLDEAEATIFRGPRRVIPIGDWLTVAEEHRITPAQFRRLYDVTSCHFPGMLYPVSPRPRQGLISDADDIELEYVDAAALGLA